MRCLQMSDFKRPLLDKPYAIEVHLFYLRILSRSHQYHVTSRSRAANRQIDFAGDVRRPVDIDL